MTRLTTLKAALHPAVPLKPTLGLPRMIHVDQLSKTYGAVQAISGVSFQVEAGAVVGLLGPNGAGKTTTMRILCGCIGATEGSATINGKDVAAARRCQSIDRLPARDTAPLRPHGRPRLHSLRRTIKGVADPDAATAAVIETVGLDQDIGGMPAADRIIAHLSKGYQQRVGLAQALVHSPSVLVLDEPTSGLDPAQRRDLRDLLQRLARAQNRTVILSTHVLAEVEAICDEVVIISGGRVVAQDRIDALRDGLRFDFVWAVVQKLVADALGHRARLRGDRARRRPTAGSPVTADVRAAVARLGRLRTRGAQPV